MFLSNAPLGKRERILFEVLSIDREKTGRGLILTGVFLFALMLTFSHVLLTGPERTSGRYDIYRYYGPVSFYMDHSIHNGEFPLWNPFEYCGSPFAANPQSFVFYPPNIVRSVLTFHPTPYRTQVGLVALVGMHMLLVALGTYAFARSHKLSISAACTAAVAFTFSALMVRRASEYHLLFTIGWLPLILLTIKNMLDAASFRRRLTLTCVAGLLFGIAILGGFMQVINYMGLTMGVYALLYRILYPRKWDGVKETATGWVADGVLLVMVLVIGTAVAAAMLLPLAELATFTAREKGSAVTMYSDLSKWSFKRLYQSIVVFPGMRYEAETLRASGVAALLLVAASLTHRRWRLVLLFAVPFVMLCDCCLGPPMPVSRLVNWLTPFSASAYTRAFDFALLPLSLLAGLGVDAVTGSDRKRWRSVVRTVIVSVAGAATLIPLAMWTKTGFFIHVSPFAYFLPAAGLGLILFAGWPAVPKRSRVFTAFLLPFLVFGETLVWNDQFIPYMVKKRHPGKIFVDKTERNFPQSNVRETDPIPNRFMYSLRTAMNGAEPLHIKAVRDHLSGYPRSDRPHRVIENWEPTVENHRGNLYLKRLFWLARQYATGPMPGKHELFPATTTVFLEAEPDVPVPKISRSDLPARGVSDRTVYTELDAPPPLYEPVRSGQSFDVSVDYRLPRSIEDGQFGPAGAVHSILCLHYQTTRSVQVDVRFYDNESDRVEWGKRHRVVPTRKEDVKIEVPMPDIASGRARIMVKESRGAGEFGFTQAYILSDQNDEDGLIKVVERRPNSVTLEVGVLDEPRILTFLDAHYPGWTAFLDGEPIPILRANDVFKAVAVPAGTHRVRFVFSPARVYVAILLSVTAALGSVVALVLLNISTLRAGPHSYLRSVENFQ